MTALLVTLCAVVGVALGRVLNRRAALVGAPGATPAGERTTVRDLAVRPPAVEMATGLLFALTALWTGPDSALPAFLVLAAALVLLTVTDLQHHLLPNRVVLPALAVGAAFLLVSALIDGRWGDLGRAAAGAGLLFAGYLVLALVAPAGMGMGDVKLAALLGLYLGWVGWDAVLVGAVAGPLLQAAAALVLLALRRVGRRSDLPFGPALMVGALVGLGWGSALLSGS